jgi:hypothetical protein
MGRMLDRVTLRMMTGERIRPARVPGIQSSSQNVPYSAMNRAVARSLFTWVYPSGIMQAGAAAISRSQGRPRCGPLAM